MKIVSLSPSITETLYALGAADLLVGVTNHCPELGADSLRLGSPKALKIEEMLKLAPDLVLADQNENRPEEVREIQKKYCVQNFDVRSIPAAIDAVWALGRLVGKMEAAAELKEEIHAAQDQARCAGTNVGARLPRPEQGGETLPLLAPVRTLILLWNQPSVTVNFDTYPSRLVEAAGGTNVFCADPVREFAVEIEEMLERNPELLLLASDPFPFRKRHVEGFRKYRVFSKIRIEIVDGKFFSRWGARTAEAVKELRRIISFSLAVGHDAVGHI